MTSSFFKNINDLAGKSKILDSSAVFFAEYLLYLMILFLSVFAVYDGSWQIFVYPIMSGLFATFGINKIIYYFYKEKRPAEFKDTNVLISVPKNPSFPSRHSAFVFGMSFYLFSFSTPLATLFLICSCFVGLSRVFVGVHWPQDIFGGAITGLLSSIILTYFLAFFIG